MKVKWEYFRVLYQRYCKFFSSGDEKENRSS
jgi:hypothetical protein